MFLPRLTYEVKKEKAPRPDERTRNHGTGSASFWGSKEMIRVKGLEDPFPAHKSIDNIQCLH